MGQMPEYVVYRPNPLTKEDHLEVVRIEPEDLETARRIKDVEIITAENEADAMKKLGGCPACKRAGITTSFQTS